MQKQKLNTRLEFPTILNMKPYTQHYLQAKEANQNNTTPSKNVDGKDNNDDGKAAGPKTGNCLLPIFIPL
jgi:hypothetical protein